MNKGIKLDKGNYTIEVKYSPKAVAEKLMKFTVVEGNEIVLSMDELISMMVNQVNSETLSATFVETDRINVVEVNRQIRCVLDRDYKKGEVVNINYSHPYPIEFALIEEAWKIAKIKGDSEVTGLTVDYINEVKAALKPEMEKYIRKFYESFKSVNLKDKKNMAEENQNPVEETVAPEATVEAPVEEAAAPAEEAAPESEEPRV